MSSEEEDKKARDIAAAKSAAAAARVVVDATWRVEVPIASKEQQQQRTSSRKTNEKTPSPIVAKEARANAVLTLRERTGGTGGHATTTIRLTEEECLELRDSMDEAAKRVKEVMEKYGGNG